MMPTVFDNGTTVIRHRLARAERASTLVVTFDPVLALDVTKPAFGEPFLTEAGFDVLCVQKRAENWYQDLSVNDLRDATAVIIPRYERVFTYGSSMGGYAALYFAATLNARALSYSPRHPIYYRHVNWPHYAHQFDMTHFQLREAGDPAAEHLVIYDPMDAIDGPYFTEQVAPAFPRARVIRLHYSGHPATTAVHEVGLIKRLALDFFQGAAIDTRGVRLTARKSKTYAANLAKSLARRRQRAAIEPCPWIE